MQTGLKWLNRVVFFSNMKTPSYLFVHEDVDDRVVDSSCLGKEGRDGSQPGVNFNGRMSCDKY